MTPEPDNTVAIVAIAVSGGVALIAAIIAPVTAHFRQKKALEAEAGRLRDQLAHDRQIRDTEDARTRVDEVVDMGEAALSAVCEARVRSRAGRWSESDEQLAQAHECLGQYGYKERRVRLRLGNDGDLISALVHYRQAVQALFELAQGAIGQRNEVPVDAWNIQMAMVAEAQAGVISTGEATLGARLTGAT